MSPGARPHNPLMTSTQRFPSEVVQLLSRAGWFEGRRVPDRQLAAWEAEVATTVYPMFALARSALREFGGLTVGESAPGVHHARAALRFEPMLGDDVDQLAHVVGGQIYPLGDADGGHGVIGMDAAGC